MIVQYQKKLCTETNYVGLPYSVTQTERLTRLEVGDPVPHLVGHTLLGKAQDSVGDPRVYVMIGELTKLLYDYNQLVLLWWSA